MSLKKLRVVEQNLFPLVVATTVLQMITSPTAVMVKQRYLVGAIIVGLAFMGIRTLWLDKPFLETAAIFFLIAVLVYTFVKPRRE